MATYKMFLIRDGAPLGQLERERGDDLEALEAARDLCADHAVEIWHDGRLIGRVKRNESWAFASRICELRMRGTVG